MAHKKNKVRKAEVKPAEHQTIEEAVGLPVFNPNTPEGMAPIFSAGICDPRPGGYPEGIYPNQQWALIQSWIPTSRMWWDLGMRYHPELATKWLKGGGQFGLAEIVDEPPPSPATINEIAQEMAGTEYPKLLAEVERVRDHGTDAEKAALRRQFETGQSQMWALAKAFDPELLKDS